MKLDIFLLIFIGYSIRIARSGGSFAGKHVKIIVPVPIHYHKHIHTVYKKPKEEKKIIIHKHEHKHGHGHKHGHKHKHGHHHGHKHNHGHKHGHHHGHKHKHNHYHQGHGHNGHKHYDHKNNDWSHHLGFGDNTGFKPSPQIGDSYIMTPTFNEIDSGPESEFIDDDGYHHLHKSVRSENYHIQEVKHSGADDPIGKHFVTGTYKVHETDPNDFTTTGYHTAFQAPLANMNLLETSYEPTAQGPVDEEYEDSDEVDYGKEDSGEENWEEFDYADTMGPVQRNGAANSDNGYGLEALKQFFQSKG